MPEMTITSPYVHSRVDSITFTMGIGQPYARVDPLNPMTESTVSPSQVLWIWPQNLILRGGKEILAVVFLTRS